MICRITSVITSGDIQTQEQVWELISRSIKCHDTLPERPLPPRGDLSFWVEISESWRHLDEPDYKEIKVRFEPTRRDIDDYLDGLALICKAKQLHRLPLLRARAWGYSFGQIATKVGRNPETHRIRFKRSLSAIHYQALQEYPSAPILEGVFKK
jgi:hypothetical protein